jgi:hypothetical protein
MRQTATVVAKRQEQGSSSTHSTATIARLGSCSVSSGIRFGHRRSRRRLKLNSVQPRVEMQPEGFISRCKTQ